MCFNGKHSSVCNAIDKDNVYSCCTLTKQCGINQGDCDTNSECSGNLICGKDNCPSAFPSDADCCEPGNFSMFLIKYITTNFENCDNVFEKNDIYSSANFIIFAFFAAFNE